MKKCTETISQLCCAILSDTVEKSVSREEFTNNMKKRVTFYSSFNDYTDK